MNNKQINFSFSQCYSKWPFCPHILLFCTAWTTCLREIWKRKANWIGHILRRNCLLKQVIEGKIKEEMDVKRRRGRRRKKLLDDLKDRRGYSHLKEEALDLSSDRLLNKIRTTWMRCSSWKLQNVHQRRKYTLYSHHIIKCNVGHATFLHSARQEIHNKLMPSFTITPFEVK